MGLENGGIAVLARGTTLVTASVPSIHAGTTPCPRRIRHRCAQARHTSIPPASGLITVDLIDRDRLGSEAPPENRLERPGTSVATFGAGTTINDRNATPFLSYGA